MIIRRARFALLALAATTAVSLSAVWAQDAEDSVVVEGPALEAPATEAPVAEAPTLPPPPMAYEGASVEASPVVVAPAVRCYPIQVLREHASLSAKRAYRCHGAPIHQVLCVDNPADCCRKLFSVPVCVPACCVDQPVCVSSNVGLLGRGYATYCWQCGFEATITFRVHGGVLIAYR